MIANSIQRDYFNTGPLAQPTADATDNAEQDKTETAQGEEQVSEDKTDQDNEKDGQEGDKQSEGLKRRASRRLEGERKSYKMVRWDLDE